jgi:transposase
MQFTHFVGIDVSKSWLDFVAADKTKAEPLCIRVANSTGGVIKALKTIRKFTGGSLDQVLFCLEHTGVYCHPFLKVAGKTGLKISLESAWKIKRTHSPRGKNDKLDALRICQYARRYQDELRLWAKEDDTILEMKELMALRQRLLKVLASLEVPIKELKAVGSVGFAKLHQEASAPVIAATKAQIKEVDKKIDELFGSAPELEKNYDLITSIKGIGRQTAIWLILFTHNFERIPSASKLACYSGIAPFNYESGSSYRGRSRVSGYANKRLKAVLHMAALSAIRYNNDIRAYYARKVAEGKNKMLVVNAVRRKIIDIVYAVIKRQAPYIEFPNNISQKISA